MKGKKILPIIISFLLLTPLVYGFGPTTHGYINTNAIPELPDSSIKQTIVNNRAYYDACFVAVDTTVLYYYTSASTYEATHSWSFCDALMKTAETDQQKACAYGCVAHLIQDSVSHNLFVPKQIRSLYIPNFPLHPLAEARFEAHIIKDYPIEYTKIQRVLKPLLQDEVMLDKFQQAVSTQTVLDVREHLKLFNSVLGDPGGFYSQYYFIGGFWKGMAYGDSTTGIIFLVLAGVTFALGYRFNRRLLKYIPTILFTLIGVFLMVGGISGLTTSSDFNYYMQIAIDRSQQVFTPQGWSTRYRFDPTGFTALNEASQSIMWVWVLIGIIFVGLIVWYVWRRFFKKK